ncbi:MAG: redox-regulated ATPase YchF [Candidatus Abawacabacteria bacterium]|nr:redox-regulated ATPase YchF [Candidatus Abawacabacteria bacterium]
MSLALGIVGLPNVGKSTLFNTLTKTMAAQASNYPFCTIDPNVGVVEVPDNRLNVLAKVVNTKKVVPAIVEFIDIAGIVKGASQGEGLGNKFLANIREADAIIHIFRLFADANVTHVHGTVDAKRDIEVINTELMLADLDSLKKQIDSLQKKAKGQDKEAIAMVTIGEKLLKALEHGALANTVPLSNEEKELAKRFQLITQKPVLFVANISEEQIKDTDEKKLAQELGLPNLLTVCAKVEAEVAQLSEEDAKVFLAEYGLTESGLSRVIRAGYDVLGLQTYFTAGEIEARAWTVKKGATAPQAAGVIHTDFEKGFIKAEVANYEDFVICNGWSGVREKGKLRLEGKEYVVQDGDVMFFKFNN